MNQYIIFSIGFLAQILFSARMLVQWFYSEKAGKVVSPLLFWQLSIFASFILIIYGILRKDLVIIAGQAITYCVYIRNLHFHGSWRKLPRPFRFLAFFFPFAAIVWLGIGSDYNFSKILVNKEIPLPLLVWGGAGQAIFTFRFIYQWICIEKANESILPLGFWVISIFGSAMVLTYAIFRRDPVLFTGQLFGFVVYGRNISIYLKNKNRVQL